MKEIDPVGGARAGGTPLDPPMVTAHHVQMRAHHHIAVYIDSNNHFPTRIF